MNVIVLLADGARVDTLASGMASGDLPALARLRSEGGMHEVTSTFPSVTGPAYAPFLMGRFPGGVGLPGLRWLDRARTTCRFPDYTRSYVGYQMTYVDDDLDHSAPTVFELVPDSVGAMSVITRGLSPERQLASLTLRGAIRAAVLHFRGNARAWLPIDRTVADRVVACVGPSRYVFAAFASTDKLSHAEGHASRAVMQSLCIVDDVVLRLRATLERMGRWQETRLWVVSDHGHSPVTRHDDVERVIADLGHRVIAHPWVYRPWPEVAVMVSGNAMAHIYVDPARRVRPYVGDWPHRARPLVEQLLGRPSVDLLLVPEDTATCAVDSATRGPAAVVIRGGRYSYVRRGGDPLGIGVDLADVTADAAHDACRSTPYPDAVVQIAHLASAPRSGDLILSAAPGWDFRARYEPIRHVSTHGALLRDHMLVPLITSHPPARAPRRTTDVFPSALAALGLAVPDGLDGASFV